MMSMDNEKLFDFMTKMYSNMQDGFKKVDGRLDTLESDVKSLKKTVLNIEQDHGKKLEFIFDGLTQHTNQLNRIEEEVKKHDEIILRRVK